MTAPWSRLIAQVAVPALVGVAGALWGDSAAAGRRAARLAAISSGLGLYLYATIAVAVLAPAGRHRIRAPPSATLSATGSAAPSSGPGASSAGDRDDRMGHRTATARLRPSLAASLASVPVTATGPAGEPSSNPVTTPHEARPVVRIRSWHGAAWLLLLWAGVAAAVFLAVVSGLRG